MALPVLNSSTGACGSTWHSYKVDTKTGITRSEEWHEKDMAEFTANIGLRCGQQCSYCSTKALNRTHHAYKTYQRKPTDKGFSFTNPQSARLMSADAKRIPFEDRARVQFCATVDAWAPDVPRGLGMDCVKAILDEPGWKIRILTKGESIIDDLPALAQFGDRVILGVSLTALPKRQAIVAVYEERTATLQKRMDILTQADKAGIPTYAMLCPLIPMVSDDYEDILELVQFSQSHNAKEIFVEALNGRLDAIPATEDELMKAGYAAEARAVKAIRSNKGWSQYAAALGCNAAKAVTTVYGDASKLRYLLYPSKLTAQDEAALRGLGNAVKWL